MIIWLVGLGSCDHFWSQEGEGGQVWVTQTRSTVSFPFLKSLRWGSQGFQGATVVKNLPSYTRDAREKGSVLGLGRSPGEENSNPLQYSCLEDSMDRGAWWATVHGVTKSQIWLSTHTYNNNTTCVGPKRKNAGYYMQQISASGQFSILTLCPSHMAICLSLKLTPSFSVCL